MRLAILAILCVCASAAPLWGPAGHELTAAVATSLLQSNANTQTQNILSGQSLSDVSNWADQVKNQPAYAWSYNLHFINTPDWACNFKPSRDCADDVCVYAAILNYTMRLTTQTDPNQVLEALKFLTHFVGDIHQPLHCGFTSDKGGNTIKGTFLGYSDNLHAIWDTYIIKNRIDTSFSGSQSQYMNYLISQVQGPWASLAQQWATCSNSSTYDCPDEWGNESAGLACQYAYTDENGNQIQDGFSLGNGYYQFTYPIVDQQLAKGGVRLASILNNVYGAARAAELMNEILPSNIRSALANL